MSIIYNGTTLTDIIYNGVSLDKVIYNGVTVFEKVSVIREPASGEYFNSSPTSLTNWRVQPSNNTVVFYWFATSIYNYVAVSGNPNSIVYGEYTYFKGSYHHSSSGNDFYGIYRIKN